MSGPMPFIEPETEDEDVVYMATGDKSRVWVGGKLRETQAKAKAAADGGGDG